MPSIQDYMSLDLVIMLITSNKQIFTEICLINAMGKEKRVPPLLLSMSQLEGSKLIMVCFPHAKIIQLTYIRTSLKI